MIIHLAREYQFGIRNNVIVHAMTIGKAMRVGKLILVCISDLTCQAILKIHNFDLHDTIPEFTPLLIFEPNILKTSQS